MPGTSIGAQNARGVLFGPLLDVEMDVLLRAEVDAQVAERRFERGEHAVGREDVVPLAAAKDARDVPPLRLVEADADARAQQLVRRVFVQRLRRVEERAALLGEIVELVVELVVERAVALDTEPACRFVRLAVGSEQQRVQVLVRELVANALDPLAPVAVCAVRDRRAQHAEGNLLAVDRRRQRRLELRRLLFVPARERAEVTLAGESRQLDRAEASVHRALHPPRQLETRDVLVVPVDRVQVEVLLQPGEVVVVLLVEVGDEAVDAFPVRVELRAKSSWP